MRYFSRGKKISKSTCHKDLWIIETSSGWYSVYASVEQMVAMNPPDPTYEVKGNFKLTEASLTPRGWELGGKFLN